MLISISQENLLQGLQTVHRAVSPTSTVPALTGVMLSAQDGGLRLVASDSEISIETSVPADVEARGAVILPARYLLDIVRKIPGGQIRMSVDPSNWTSTLKWARSQFTVHGTEPSQFPEISFEPKGPQAILPQAKLRDMIRRSVFAVAQSESRPILTGELLELIPGEIRLVAIDGVRLAFCKESVDWDDAGSKAVIPGRSLNEVSKLLSSSPDAQCKLSISNNQAHFELGSTRFLSRLLEGQFPPYEQIIPQKFRTTITLDRLQFHDACERASLLSADNDKTIRIEARDDLLVITSNSPEVGKVMEEIECTIDGDALEIAFNARYLIEGLRAIDSERVHFQANGAFSPCRIKPVDRENIIYIAMPLRTLGE